MNYPKVFIIILHYGEVKDTMECLSSLGGLAYPNFEVVVVDNDPENRLEELNFKYPCIKLVNGENLGFAGGNNAGIKYALDRKADYILLLNNDTVIEPDFLKILVGAGEKNEEIGILGPIIYKLGTKEPHFAGGKINWLYTKAEHRPGAEDYITGACLLIKRKVIERIGLMPEDYFLYFEDAEWCLKARRAGFFCKVVPEAKIWHKVSKNTKECSFFYIYYHYRNSLIFCRRNAPIPMRSTVPLLGFLIYLKELLKMSLIPSKKTWSKATILAIKDFWQGNYGKVNINKKI